MRSSSRLFNMFSDVRRIAGGGAAGLQIVPLEGDREFALGTYELPVQAALADRVGAGGVVYDVGANIGFFTLLAARCVGPAGRVYAFEPVDRNAAAIERSVRLNGFATVEVFRNAVGASNGAADLNLARHIGGAVLATVGVPPDRRGSVTVEVVSLDSVIAERGLRPPSLVKIDVEGAELDVLSGMRQTLRAHRPVLICEADDATREGLRLKTEALSAALAGLGYSLTGLAPSYPDAGWHVAHFVAEAAADR
jgi:FkbM family methyltransferase